MKVVCIADTHGLHKGVSVPDGDLLIVAGDFCNQGTLQEAIDFNKWLITLPHKYKVVVAGNHDWITYEMRNVKDFNSKMLSACTYLQDSMVTIEGVTIYGTPWQPEFCDWAYNLPRDGEELDRKFGMIPTKGGRMLNVDILVTHSPPYGYFDKNQDGERCGCKVLAKHVLTRIKPLYHVFGHLHTGGMCDDNGITFVNAAILDDNYNIKFNPPTFVVRCLKYERW
jgi:Icc-related predicted phosphoesterase